MCCSCVEGDEVFVAFECAAPTERMGLWWSKEAEEWATDQVVLIR
jgi:hypothetical protein